MKHSTTIFLNILLCVVIFLNPPTIVAQGNDVPDLIIFNGNIITMEANDTMYSYLEVKDGNIIKLDTVVNADLLADDTIAKIDLNGKTLLPGFIDSHSHWIGDRSINGRTLDQAIYDALGDGFTTINEMFVNEGRLNELINQDGNKQLKLRVNAYLPLSYSEQRFGDWYQAYTPHQMVSENVRIGGVKLFMDGGQFIGYVNRNWWFTPEELNPIVKTAHDLGFQVAIHAITDNATDMALNAMDLAQGDNSDGTYRHRLEHAIMLRDDQISRLYDMNVTVSGQLLWMNSDWVDDIETEAGYETYLSYLSRWRDVIDANVTFVGSTDFPWLLSIPDKTSIEMMYRATTRIGTEGLTPPDYMLNQTISVEEVIHSMTIDAAFANFEEEIKGSVKIGKLADFTILSDYPMNKTGDAIRNLEVDMTVIGGELMFCRDTNFHTSCPVYDFSEPSNSNEPSESSKPSTPNSPSNTEEAYFPVISFFILFPVLTKIFKKAQYIG